jgi:hypothetical protein
VTLRTEAAAAYLAAQTARDAEAKAALAAVLSSPAASGMTLVETVVEDAFTMLVFTDTDLHFAVRAEAQFDATGARLADLPWTVTLVAKASPDDAGWTSVADITSLPDLGASLPLVPLSVSVSPAMAKVTA